MNRNQRLTNICTSIPTSEFPNWSDEKFCKYLEELPYLQEEKNEVNFFFTFQRERTEEGYEHWQIYCEFNKQVYFTILKNDFRCHIEARKWEQAKAINYCQKERTRVGKNYTRGKAKEFARNKKIEKKKVKDENAETIRKIVRKIQKCKYNSFFEIGKKEPEIFETNKELLRSVWNSYNHLTRISAKSCRVIWCFGEARAGKSTWTDKFLRVKAWKREEIVEIFPNNMTYNDRIIFKIDDEKGKVLVINEVDENFPRNNNLIAFIDRKAALSTEKSEIRNNFELVIINSVLRPEEIFGYLGKRIAGQVLGRIFEPYIGCEVYEIKKNQEQLDRIISESLVFTDEEFQDWYQPIIKKISEPDYTLIEKE